MAKTGVLIELGDGKVKETNFGVLTAARGASGDNEVCAFVMNADAEAIKSELSAYGASKIVNITSSGDLGASPDLQAASLAAAAKEYGLDALLGLFSATGRDIFARVAAIMDEPMISDCISVDIDGKTGVKSHFSGKTFATIKLDCGIMLATVRPNAIEPAEASVDAEVISFSPSVENNSTVKIIEVKKGGTEKLDLTEAPVIVTGGRAIKASENYKMLEECAALLGAAVGASRAAVDAGYAPHSMQVGQTGKTVSPKLYIACGVSGAVQHFAGMKTSKIIVGINTDKDAPIFAKCDYGIVGDIFEVVPALTEALR
ncbi:Electron transfer flavoprotein subunit alpha [Desulfamplus magnetovallimortis]|uniref:Electron transfer flavoprotein subunit alpha n=1 Tax=Desulfamplus magnetovallimortis TaxID=1246637 RepID=A0A1W1HGC6_9BACT|nr:electron transfer flavoprotein subunit alpha/FixB family protein [Desulfamplus magnetovallimortis]SLM31473.1 Electron transfer flavoprotein subunit alpha [Desulfamplus magnetovallimortis]